MFLQEQETRTMDRSNVDVAGNFNAGLSGNCPNALRVHGGELSGTQNVTIECVTGLGFARLASWLAQSRLSKTRNMGKCRFLERRIERRVLPK